MSEVTHCNETLFYLLSPQKSCRVQLHSPWMRSFNVVIETSFIKIWKSKKRRRLRTLKNGKDATRCSIESRYYSLIDFAWSWSRRTPDKTSLVVLIVCIPSLSHDRSQFFLADPVFFCATWNLWSKLYMFNKTGLIEIPRKDKSWWQISECFDSDPIISN